MNAYTYTYNPSSLCISTMSDTVMNVSFGHQRLFWILLYDSAAFSKIVVVNLILISISTIHKSSFSTIVSDNGWEIVKTLVSKGWQNAKSGNAHLNKILSWPQTYLLVYKKSVYIIFNGWILFNLEESAVVHHTEHWSLYAIWLLSEGSDSPYWTKLPISHFHWQILPDLQVSERF